MQLTQILITIFVFLPLSVQGAQNILIIGDSHTAGHFGKTLHHKIVEQGYNVVTLGHSSSAPMHWINSKSYQLRGGVFNQAVISRHEYDHPNNLKHWRVPITAPKFKPLIFDMLYHSLWKNEVGAEIKPDYVVIALGANDLGFLGEVGSDKYNRHKKYAESMIQVLKDNQLSCVWIGPPSGTKKSKTKNNIVYEYLKETVTPYCPLYDSRKFLAECPDGRHFNCGGEMDERAEEWAEEVSNFALKNIE